MSRQLATTIASRAHSLRSDVPLTDEQILAVAPSILAVDKHQDRSARYTYIPTLDVLKALRKEGFQPFMVAQSKPKAEDRFNFAKHMLRLRHESQINADEANEIVLVNSHDGTSSYQMLAGVFRFVCQNGCVAGSILEDIRVPHRGDIVGNVIEGSYTILDGFEKVDASKDEMKGMLLTRPEQMAFARAAMALKYDKPDEAPFTAEKLLVPQRMEDRDNDLWTVFQRTQEHLIKGGVQGRTATNRRTRTRGVNSISDNIKLNSALWTLAETMKQLKRTDIETIEVQHAA